MTHAPLAKPLRTQLENTVKSARDIAETAARAALQQLAVGEGRVPDYLNDAQRALRRRLRAHGRSLGDAKHDDDTQELRRLVWEVAYEHWHRMLFARFLAENGLLLWEPGAAVSLQDCREMVDNHPEMAMGARSEWELAGKLAARMLPQVFKPQHPVFELVFAPEHQREQERLLSALPSEVFQASDSLGWVYQFWQARRKDEVNASEVKIGADELPAVTQLFTEPYMVDFLLHNSLGAWWLTRHPDTPCPVPLTYLRTLPPDPTPPVGAASAANPPTKNVGAASAANPTQPPFAAKAAPTETPAAGRFEDWPDTLADFKLLDPCCGSGHFLVAAFLLLVPMRMTAERLSAREAVDAVLRDNLHGLELDPRCVEIAVFALALAAWRFPDEAGQPLGVREDMPAPNIACCGLKVAARAAEWMALVPDDVPNAAYLRQELRLLHDSFSQAPLLGSLLDPARSLKNDLATTSFDTLRALLERALSTERLATLWGEGNEVQEEAWDHALTARGLLDAARLLDARYHLVVTNVPYVGQKKMAQTLREYTEQNYFEGRADLAAAFMLRSLELCDPSGCSANVAPQSLSFLSSYSAFREKILRSASPRMLVKLGAKAFQSQLYDFAVGLWIIFLRKEEDVGALSILDVSSSMDASAKAGDLVHASLKLVNHESIPSIPDMRFTDAEIDTKNLLSKHAISPRGIVAGDLGKWVANFWEHPCLLPGWRFLQGVSDGGSHYGGRNQIIDWRTGGVGMLRPGLGNSAYGKKGVAISRMAAMPSCLYSGELYDQNVSVIIPHDESLVPALLVMAESSEFRGKIREIDQKVGVTPGTLLKVSVDLDYWRSQADSRFPEGLSEPYSDDPSQWLFHGHPQPATDPLQVAVARLLGYRWPAETDAEMELADEAREWIAQTDKLAAHADDDGIVCLPAVRGEKPAHERLLALLIDAWETVTPGSWKASTLDRLLAEADCAGKSLEVWLREKFFEQHARRFHHRPFIWHLWDGLKDGFGALVNYHKLDARNLERLIHTYLGDWIRIQEAGVASGLDGAPQRLAAAQALKKKLEAILEGEAPFDIFVRWKPLAEQAIGWNPDLNDGVRLNIRPWMTAGVLRHNKGPKLNIKWDKDRGKDVESAPWFHKFKGDRINDYHLTLAEKRAARE
jgi:hypothetical protein